MVQALLKNCPVCKKKAIEKFNPFCSQRCADIDLGAWLGEKYRLPTNETVDAESLPTEDSDIE